MCHRFVTSGKVSVHSLDLSRAGESTVLAVIVPLNHLAVLEVTQEANSLPPEWLIVRMSDMPTLSQFDFAARQYPFRQTLMNCAAVSDQWWYIFISAPWETTAEIGKHMRINLSFRFAPACLGSIFPSTVTEWNGVRATITHPSSVFGFAKLWTVCVCIFGAVAPVLAVNELIELARATMGDTSTNVVVLLDLPVRDDANAIFQWLSSLSPGEGRVFELFLSQGAVRPLSPPADYSLGDPTIVASVIARSVRRFPAKRYAFLTWMRGGYLPCTFEVPADDEVAWNLLPRELAKGLLLGLALAGLAAFDVLFLDVPSMACLEVMITLSSAATFITATQHPIGLAGWNYTAMFQMAAQNQLTIPRLVVDALVPFDGSSPQSLTIICTAAYVTPQARVFAVGAFFGSVK